jgi:hypothetical protein
MKQFFEYIVKFIPLLVITIIVYLLFLAPDSQMSEGVKLSLSALLGAISSYIFIQYANFILKIDSKKAVHARALASLEIKLNDQLNWLSDIIFHLKNQRLLIQKVINEQSSPAFDASSYREPISIESEIYDVNNIDYKNKLLSLHTSYKKIQNDITSIQSGYKFMLEQVLSNPKYIDSYLQGLPHYLANLKLLHSHSEQTIDKTKDALAACRVLSRDTKNILSKLSLYFVIHKNPTNFENLVVEEKRILNDEIKTTQSNSKAEIDEIENIT